MRENYFRKTKQFWKLNLVLYSVIITGGLMYYVIPVVDYKLYLAIRPFISATAIFIIGSIFLWVIISVKCPKCGTRVLLWLIKKGEIKAIKSITKCPVCNYGEDEG